MLIDIALSGLIFLMKNIICFKAMFNKKLLFAFLLFISISGCEKSSSDKSIEQSSPPVVAHKGWVEKSSIDSFTKEDTSVALLDSENSAPVGVSGKSIRPTLVAFRNDSGDPRVAAGKIWFGAGAMPLGRTHGYGDCYSEVCYILAKFDDGNAIKYDVYEPSAGDDRGVLIINSKDLFQRAFKAKKIEIRVRFYQEGNGDFTFINPEPFSWSIKHIDKVKSPKSSSSKNNVDVLPDREVEVGKNCGDYLLMKEKALSFNNEAGARMYESDYKKCMGLW